MRNLCLTSFLLIALSSLSLHAQGTWSALGIGFNGNCRALTSDKNGTIYAGGEFTRALTSFGDSKEVNYVARWNGSEWLTLGKGLDGSVSAIAMDKNNRYLYVCGNFKNAFQSNGLSISTPYVARWDKVTGNWLPVGNGTDSSCSDILFDANNVLYITGQFEKAGGIPAKRIAKWDGSTWSPLGLGMNDGGIVLAMDSKGLLYAGGWFSNAGGINVSGIASWDGTLWSDLDGGLSGGYRVAAALALDSKDNLYVGGFFSMTGAVSSRNIAMWDGVQWQALGQGLAGGFPLALATDAEDHLYVGGSFNRPDGGTAGSLPFIAYWNGNWNALGDGLDSSCYALHLAADGRLYAGGAFSIAGNTEAHFIAKWTPAALSAAGMEAPDEELQIYPQPAGSTLRVALPPRPGRSTNAEIEIYSGSGRLLIRNSSGVISGEIVQDIGKLPSGLYFLRVQSSGNVYARLFVKQ